MRSDKNIKISLYGGYYDYFDINIDFWTMFMF